MGLTLQEIADEVGVSKQRISQYADRTNQKNIRENAKLEKKKLPGIVIGQIFSPIDDIVSQIEQIALGNSSEGEKFAYQKTCEYMASLKYKGTSLTEARLYDLFLDYYNSMADGKKKSLDNFVKDHGFSWRSEVGRIFKKVELKAQVKPPRKRRVKTSNYKKEVMGRSFEVRMSNRDIAHFLSVPRYIVSEYFRRESNEGMARISYESPYSLDGRLGSGLLTCASFSQIFDAKDAGFSDEDILKSFDRRVYDYAVSNRKDISGSIMDSLRVMFPDKDVRNPYVDFDIS